MKAAVVNHEGSFITRVDNTNIDTLCERGDGGQRFNQGLRLSQHHHECSATDVSRCHNKPSTESYRARNHDERT